MNPASLVQEKIRLFIEKLGKSLSKKHGVVPKGYIDVNKLCKSHSKKHGVVPKGYIPVYVEGKRYKVPLKYLSRPAFQKLIEKSQTDVFDPKIEGPLLCFDRCTAYDFHKSLENFMKY
ncbi:hypothetical protein ACE6H2_026766 [Prunus campanulata]